MAMLISISDLVTRRRENDPKELLQKLLTKLNYIPTSVNDEVKAQALEALRHKGMKLPSQLLVEIAVSYGKYRKNALIDIDPAKLDAYQLSAYQQCFSGLTDDELVEIVEEYPHLRIRIWGVIAKQSDLRFDTFTRRHICRLGNIDPFWTQRVWIRKARDWEEPVS